jgi:hypothetical protein
MKILEALDRLKNGNPIRMKNWDYHDYLILEKDIIYIVNGGSKVAWDMYISDAIKLDKEWELYEGKVPFYTIGLGRKFMTTKNGKVLTKVVVEGHGIRGLDQNWHVCYVTDNGNDLVFIGE